MSRIDSDASKEFDVDIFQTVADTELSTKEKAVRKIDRSVLAPIRILWDDWRGKLGASIILLFILMGTVGVRVIRAPYTDSSALGTPPFRSLTHPLGTTSKGVDILSQIVHGTPPMLKMILAGGIFAILVGTLVGMVSGYKGGLWDQALMACTDILLTIPGLPLIIVLTFVFEPRNPYYIGIILAINNWTGLARAIRSQMLPLRDIEYVEASRTMGISTPGIIQRDIVPNLMPYVVVNFVGASRLIIFQSVGLYYLGVLPASQQNWGLMMQRAYQEGGALYSWDLAHWLYIPMLVVILLSLGFILLAQAGDQLFNPRIRARHQKTTTDAGGMPE